VIFRRGEEERREETWRDEEGVMEVIEK